MEITYQVVAGGAGFVGSALCERLLETGHEQVVCVDSLVRGKEARIAHLTKNPRFTFLKADVREPFLIPGRITRIFHLCDLQQDSLDALRTRGEGTLRLLERAARDKARIVVAPAASAPCAERPEGSPHAEALALAFAKERGLDVRVVRLASVFGPGVSPSENLVAAYIESSLKRRPIAVEGEGANATYFLYLDDAVEALYRAAEAELPAGKVLFLADSRQVPSRELARLVARACGTRVRIAFDPSAPVEPKAPVVTSPEAEEAQRLLSWAPQCSLEEALAETVGSLREVVGPPEPRRRRRPQPPATLDTLFRNRS